MARAIEDSWDPNDLGVLKRLEALLALWIHPPYWRPLDERYHDGLPSHGAPELLSEHEESIWERFLVDARVHEPASTIGGLRRALRTRKVSAKEHPVRALSSSGGITFVEGRVAVKRASAMSPFGRSWFLSAPWTRELEEVAEKKAEHVDRCADRLLAAYPKSKRDRLTRLVITALAERARSDADLLDAYFKATAMDIADAVVDAISTVQRTRLGALLGGILRRSCARLHWTVDLRLGMFESYARDIRGSDLRGNEISRVGALFEAYRALERVGSYWGISALVEDYYESIARGFALAGEVGELGNTLSVLPAGPRARRCSSGCATSRGARSCGSRRDRCVASPGRWTPIGSTSSRHALDAAHHRFRHDAVSPGARGDAPRRHPGCVRKTGARADSFR